MIGVHFALLSNTDVVTNLRSITLKDKHKTIMFKRENMFNPEYYDNKFMLIDEYYLESDKREALSQSNKMWSYFAQMSRKYPLSDIVFIAQRLNLFDTRIVEMFDFLIEAYNNSDEKRFEYSVLRVHDMKRSNFIIRYTKSEVIFNHYDSNEIPVAQKLDKLVFMTMSQESRNKLALELSDSIKAFYPDCYSKKFKALLDIEGYLISKNLEYDSKLLKQIKFYLKSDKK